MIRVFSEIERRLDEHIDARCQQSGHHPRKQIAEDVYDDFAAWLVEKFVQETAP